MRRTMDLGLAVCRRSDYLVSAGNIEEIRTISDGRDH